MNGKWVSYCAGKNENTDTGKYKLNPGKSQIKEFVTVQKTGEEFINQGTVNSKNI